MIENHFQILTDYAIHNAKQLQSFMRNRIPISMVFAKLLMFLNTTRITMPNIYLKRSCMVGNPHSETRLEQRRCHKQGRMYTTTAPASISREILLGWTNSAAIMLLISSARTFDPANAANMHQNGVF